MDPGKQVFESLKRRFLLRDDAYDAVRDLVLELEGPGAVGQLPAAGGALDDLFDRATRAMVQRRRPEDTSALLAAIEEIAERAPPDEAALTLLVLGDASAPAERPRTIRDALRQALPPNAPSIAIVADLAPTPVELARLLIRHQPGLLHWVGDGAPPAGVALRGRTEARIAPPQLLEDALHGLAPGALRLMVLDGCFEPAQAEALSGRAVVLGLVDGFDAALSRDFEDALYGALFAGRSLDDATHVARAALGLEEISAAGSPRVVAREGVDLSAIRLDAAAAPPDPHQRVRVLLVFDGESVPDERLAAAEATLRPMLGDPDLRGITAIPGSVGWIVETTRQAAIRLDALARDGGLGAVSEAIHSPLRLVQVPGRRPVRLTVPPPVAPQAPPASKPGPTRPSKLPLGLLGAGLVGALAVGAAILLWPDEPPPPPPPEPVRVEPEPEPEPPPEPLPEPPPVPEPTDPCADHTPQPSARVTLRTSTDVDLNTATLRWWTHGRRQPCVQESPTTWTCGADETGPFHVLAEARCLEPGRLNLEIASNCGHAVTQDVTLDLSELVCEEDAASVIVTVLDAAGRPATPREVLYTVPSATRRPTTAARPFETPRPCTGLDDGTWSCGDGRTGAMLVGATGARGEVARQRVVVEAQTCCPQPETQRITLRLAPP